MQNNEPSSAIELPLGVKDFLPKRAARMKSLEELLYREFRLWGYKEIITPTIEYLDVIAKGEPDLLEMMFKFEDRVSGRMLALRPDFTAQIARLVSTHLTEYPTPARLSYSGSVLHYSGSKVDKQREIYQAGLELIGISNAEADGEVIAVAIESILGTGLRDFKIDIGQVGFFRGVIEGLDISYSMKKEVEDAVARKDRSGIETLLPSLKLKESDEEALLAMPTMFGDRSVLDKAQNLAVNKKAELALENLSEVLDTIDLYGLMDYITVDLGEIRRLNYYSGVIFEGFVSGMGEEICGGGRYDNLLNSYGYNMPATGFAINLESLMKALDGQREKEELKRDGYLIVNRNSSRNDAFMICKKLRAKGVFAVREIEERDSSESLVFAGRENLKGVITVEDGVIGKDEIYLQNIGSEEKQKMKIDDLI